MDDARKERRSAWRFFIIGTLAGAMVLLPWKVAMSVMPYWASIYHDEGYAYPVMYRSLVFEVSSAKRNAMLRQNPEETDIYYRVLDWMCDRLYHSMIEDIPPGDLERTSLWWFHEFAKTFLRQRMQEDAPAIMPKVIRAFDAALNEPARSISVDKIQRYTIAGDMAYYVYDARRLMPQNYLAHRQRLIEGWNALNQRMDIEYAFRKPLRQVKIPRNYPIDKAADFLNLLRNDITEIPLTSCTDFRFFVYPSAIAFAWRVLAAYEARPPAEISVVASDLDDLRSVVHQSVSEMEQHQKALNCRSGKTFNHKQNLPV